MSRGSHLPDLTMIEVIERCFKARMKSAEWQCKMREMIPSYGVSLDDDVPLLHAVRKRTLETLRLERMG